jgi:hypothetical protein
MEDFALIDSRVSDLSRRLDGLERDSRDFQKETRESSRVFEKGVHDLLNDLNGQLCALKAESAARSVRLTIIITLLGIMATSLLLKLILG